MKKSFFKRKLGSVALALTMTASLFTGIGGDRAVTAHAAPSDPAYNVTADSVYKTRFLELYNQIKDPNNGYFSPEGIPYHSVETLISEAPDYGHMTTSEAYSYWLWLETLYGYYTGDWSKLEAAWDNMETYIIPGAAEQPTMSYYNPSSPATYAAEHPYPDMYPSDISGQYPAGQDPLDAELKQTYGSNTTYLMHWLLDVDNWYQFGNLLSPSHTATYVNTFQRGEQESVWEAVPHPSQDDHSFGKPGEGFMTLFTKENQPPAKQWRYTNASDADARAVQVMYWAKELGYNNQVYLDKAKKMGDFLRYDMYDKYFQQIGSASDGSPNSGNGKNSAHYLMAWYTAWGGGLGDDGSGNWAWRIGSSHTHQGYQNPVAAYALSQPDGGLIPRSPTAQSDWEISLERQLEFYNWLQSTEGAIAGGATNSWNGNYSSYPSGVSTFYGMAYDDHPVYHDPGSNQWFGFQAWSVERVAELYYILASKGDTSSKYFRMAKQVIDKWVDWSIDYVFVNERPVTDNDGYYLDANGNRVSGRDPAIATVAAPGEFSLPSTLEWSGQPDPWNGFDAYDGDNANLTVMVKDPSQDVGVLGSYAKALIFYAAGVKAETGDYTDLAASAKQKVEDLLDIAWQYNDGIGIAIPEERADYYRYFTKEIYIPNDWTGVMGQGNTVSASMGVPSDPAKGGNGGYISYADLRPNIVNDPQWSYLESIYQSSYNESTGEWENGKPTFVYHRFWAQVDMATAYAEYERILGSGTGDPGEEPGEPSDEPPAVPLGLTATAGDKRVDLDWQDASRADSYLVKRSTTSGGPYTVIAQVTSSQYIDTNVTNGTTYYYVVSAVNDHGESANSIQVSATPKDDTPTPAPEGDLVVQYRAADTNPYDNQIKPHFNIVNRGSTAVNLSELTLRYYFSKDGNQPMNAWIDWAQIGSSNIQTTFTDTYVELSFTNGAGSISAGGQTGDIQLRMSKNDWSNFDETNDYSFDPTKTSYADWDRVTLYLNGQLVWGIEP